jgi:hypothetical protein
MMRILRSDWQGSRQEGSAYVGLHADPVAHPSARARRRSASEHALNTMVEDGCAT